MEETSFQRRARAPNHFWGRAEDARFAAHYLWQGKEAEPALADAFRREASLALELVLKAVIAQRLENGTLALSPDRPPMHHNLPVLWKTAGLPDLPEGDHARLIGAKHRLYWSGRYPAPLKEADYHKEDEEAKPFRNEVGKIGSRKLFQNWRFDWEDFDRIYRVAADIFGDLAPYIDDGGRLIMPEGSETFRWPVGDRVRVARFSNRGSHDSYGSITGELFPVSLPGAARPM